MDSRPPFGRRLCEVVEAHDSRGYRVFSLRDEAGPLPRAGQFYMLASERNWEDGGGRPFLPRALSVADAAPAPAGMSQSSPDSRDKRDSRGVRLDFLLDAVGPGTSRLCELEAGERVWVNGPLGNCFSEPRELAPGAAGAILVGGGVGIAPLALLRRQLSARGTPTQILLGFRDAAHSGGLDDLFSCCQIGLASEDGHVGHPGRVTDLLAAMLQGDSASTGAVYACGPEPMLEAVDRLCRESGVACELAMESPMACGFGACYGCAVPNPAGDGYIRLCVDGPVLRAGAAQASPGNPGQTRPTGRDVAGSGSGQLRPAGPVAPASPMCSDPASPAPPPWGTPAAAPPAGEAPRPQPAGGAEGGTAPEEALATGGGGGSPSATGPAGPATSGPAGRSSSGPATMGKAGGGRGPVEFCGLELEHPVINASGTFDAIAARRVYGDELLARFPFSAFVSKTITLEPRAGNEPQRIWETPSGMINSIGLPNRGLEGFLAEDLPRLAELPVPLIVSAMATGREDFGRMVAALDEREEVAAIELNVSCPNVHSGLIVGEQPDETRALLEALRPLTRRPLIVKLTPNVADPGAVAAAAEEGGADAVSLINTLKASAIDPATGRPGIAAGHGGLSGPAVRAVAVAQLREVRAAAALPIVGMGGVSSGADAAELLSAGATLVAVGTESFRDPAAGSRVARELSGPFAATQG